MKRRTNQTTRRSTATVSRRSVLGNSVLVAAATGLGAKFARAAESPAAGASHSFGLCLNTSTVRGANLGIDVVIDIAARAGFQAIEPWISELEAYEKKGGSLKELGKKLRDLGLAVP